MTPSGIALVTGATGFVGSPLVRRLLQEKFEVRALSTGSSRTRLADVERQIRWFDLDHIGIAAAVPGVSHFFNFAVAYDRPGHSDALLHEVNVALPLRIVTALGDSPTRVPCILGDSFYRKFAPQATRQVRYTASKQLLAAQADAMPADHPCSLALLLIEQIYGPGESLEKAYPRVARQLLQPVARVPLTEGTQKRDFLHVADTVEAALVAARSDWSGTVHVGCGSGVGTPVRGVFERLKDLAASPSVLGFGDIPADQTIEESVADTRWLRARGWVPEVPLETGLRDLMDDVRRRCEQLPAKP